ncbi:MAG: HAD family phosphatase [Candidatus Marinimicrobia bacterium]|nr:HAD family phosphatase [Candidatus Neomarinimicrobiota bacterium]
MVFDLGNVIVDVNCSHFANKLDISVENCKNFIEDDEFKKFELGIIDEKEFLDQLSKYDNIEQEQIKIIKDQPLLKFSLRQKTYEIIQHLRNKYNIYLLSNTNPIDFLAIDRWLDLRKIFKKCYLTYEQHYLKPSIEIYKHAEVFFGIKPNNTLFLDDKIENIRGAEKCGWTTIHVKSEGQLIEKLQEKNII